MSRGSINLEVPHFCGEVIPLVIHWSDYPGSYENPPEHDEEWECEHICTKCGIDLDYDTIFEATAKKMAEDKYEAEPEDWPQEPEDLEPPEAGWDDVWEKIDPRYN